MPNAIKWAEASCKSVLPVSEQHYESTGACLCSTLGLFQSRVCHRHTYLFPSTSSCSSRFRDMQAIVKPLLKFNNFKLYLTFTLHYTFYNFYLLLLSVGCLDHRPEVCIEMGINIWFFFMLDSLGFVFHLLFIFLYLVKSTLSVPLKFKWFEKVSDSLWHHFHTMPASFNSYMNSHSFQRKKECKIQEKNELLFLPGHLPAPEEVRKEFQGKLSFKPSTANTSRRQYFISHYKGQMSLSS